MQRIFVSRDRQLERMERMLALAMDGQGQVCFVTGEAGFGKTSLTAEFARRAQQRNSELLVAIGDCNAQSGIGDPYLPFREVLAMLAGDIDDRLAQGMTTEENASRLREFLRVSKRVIMEVGPDLIDILVPGVGLATRAGVLVAGQDGLRRRKAAGEDDYPERLLDKGWPQENDQGRIFEQVTRVFVTLAANRPLILVLDDLHWVDESSAALLFHLARRIEGSRILVVGTYRPEDVALGRGAEQHPLASVVAEIKRSYGDVVIELDEEDESEGRRFVDSIVDSESNRLDGEFRRRLYERTHGHPLFTTELLRDLQERGALVRDAQDHWVPGPALDWEKLPARVEGVIEERVNRLPPELQQMLSVASVEGEEFTAQVIGALLEADERRVLRALTRELDHRHRLVVEEGAERAGGSRISRFRFRHQMFRQYFYDNLGISERELLHEDVASELERLFEGQLDPIANRLAHHFEQAGLAERAAGYYLQAGRRAMRMYAYHEAATLAAKGLDTGGAARAAALRFELELLQGEAQLNAGRIMDAMALYRSTAQRAIAEGAADVAARAAIGYTEPRWRYNMVDSMALNLLGKALSLLDETDSALRARLLANIARASEDQRPHDELLRILDESVAMARRLGDPGVLIDCARFRFSVDRDPARVHERLALGRELVALSDAIDDKHLRAQIMVFHSMDCAAVADIDGWRQTLDAIDHIAREVGDPFHTYNATAMRVALPLLAGRFEEAERLAMEAFETGKRLGVDNVEGVMGVQMFTIRREQARLAELAPVVRHFVSDRGAGAAWRPGLALVFADLGDLDAAQREFDDLAAGRFAVVPRDALWQTCLCYLAEVCVALGDRERAATLYDMLEPYRALTAVVGNTIACLGATARYLGQLATLLGRPETAAAHYEQALAVESRIEADLWLAHTRLEFARLLERQGGAGARERAGSLRGQAMAAARQGGFARILANRDDGQAAVL